MLLSPLLALALLQGLPGHRYTVRMTSDRGESLLGTVVEDGRQVRVDFASPDTRRDDYLLVRDDEVISVHPDDREYSVVDQAAFAHIAGIGLQAASDIGVVRFRVRDARFTPERLGAGELITGYPTRHVRLTEEFTVNVRALGIWSSDVHVHVVTDYWVTETPVLMPNPLIEMLSHLGAVLGQSDPGFVAHETAVRHALFHGTPLRIVVSQWSSDEHPDTPSVQKIEISEVQSTTLNPGIFRIPAGFTQRDAMRSEDF